MKLSKDDKWHTGMTNAEVYYIERMALHQLDTTDNYITDTAKWLYDTRKSQPYFAIYSTSDGATVMFASKGKLANIDKEILFMCIKGEYKNESLDTTTRTIAELFQRLENGTNRQANNHNGSNERRSNNGNAKVYKRNARNEHYEALFNCIRNIRKTSKGLESSDSGIRSGSDVTKFSRESQTLNDLKKENETLQKRVEKWKRETRIKPQAEFDESSMNKFARGLLKSYNSTLKYIKRKLKDAEIYIGYRG